MKQDLRELFKKEQQAHKSKLKDGHEERFLKRLDNVVFKEKKKSYSLLKIAATILLLITAGVFGYKEYNKQETIETIVVTKMPVNKEPISLGDLSPDLKKVEDYYTATINVSLSNLQVSDKNKMLVDGYMEQLTKLNSEYEILTKELNESGPNNHTINALIKNLQLRLQLLQKLKRKLDQLKIEENDQII